MGNHLEANAELENITPQLRAHTEVLEIHSRVHAAAKKWDGVLARNKGLGFKSHEAH